MHSVITVVLLTAGESSGLTWLARNVDLSLAWVHVPVDLSLAWVHVPVEQEDTYGLEKSAR